MKEFLLDKAHFNENDWKYCITCRKGWDEPIKFTQEDDSVKNLTLPEEKAIVDGFEYISVVSNEALTPVNLRVELDCKFESFGAPCMVFSSEIFQNEQGINVYRHHYEFCGYERGLNIWDIENVDGKMVVKSIAKMEFPVETNKKFTIFGEFNGKTIKTGIGNVSVTLPFELPEKLHIGFTACEGINNFYSIRYGKIKED